MSYTEKLEQELGNFRDFVNISELPPIFSYWSNKYLRPKLETLGFGDPYQFYVQYISRIAAAAPESCCRILSLGAGNCDIEVHVSELLIERGVQNFAVDCLDVNRQMLERGAQDGRGVFPRERHDRQEWPHAVAGSFGTRPCVLVAVG